MREYPSTPTDSYPPRWFPPEIVEMIIAHLANDTPTLMACAATCFTWYNVATPHLHRTLILRGRSRFSSDDRATRSCPLQAFHRLGLLPFVKELQFRGTFPLVPWATPAAFGLRNMRYFRAMTNLQELKMADMDFTGFSAGYWEDLRHFSPTLQAVALCRPSGSRRQLLDFFRLFPMLEDVEIMHYSARWEAYKALDGQFVPINGGLRGRLTLYMFEEEGLLKDMIIAFGGMRFTSMNLRHVRGMQLLLEACAGTLETLRIYPDDMLNSCKGFFYLREHFCDS